jgi:hypothetical protein
MPEPQILLTGLAFGESPRWHAGRLWFANWGTPDIVTVGLDGESEIGARVPPSIPWNYTTILNIIFLLLAAALLVRFFWSGAGPMLTMMGGKATGQDHAARNNLTNFWGTR